MANFLLPPPQVANPAAAGMAGFAGVQDVQAQQQKNYLLNQKVQQDQAQQEALKQFGQTGDPKAFQGTDPVMMAKMTDWLNSQPPDSMKDITRGLNFFEQVAPTINSKTWPKIKSEAIRAYPNLPQDALPPDNATDEQLFKFANGRQLLAAQFKAMGQAPKAVNPGGSLVNPVTGQEIYKSPERATTIIGAGGETVGQVRGPVHVLPQAPEEKWKPEYFIDPKTGKGEWVKPGAMPSSPEAMPANKGSLITNQDDIKQVIDGVISGDIAPAQLSKRNTKGEYTKILAGVQSAGQSLSKLNLQYEGAKKFAGSMNSQQMVRFKGLAGSVVNTIDEVGALADELKQSGIVPLNKIGLEAKIKLAGNSPQGQLATRYLAATNTLKEEFANLAQGGYAPTEAVWSLANKQINENYGVDQMKASLGEVKRLINYRVQAFDELQPMTTGTGQHSGQGGTSGMTPIGKAPDGRTVYRNAQGQMFTQ